MKKISSDVIAFLNESVDASRNYKWSINPETGLVDVDGDVQIIYDTVKNGKLPVEFGKVTGGFYAFEQNLVTLEGCPYWVGGDFYVFHNNLKNLKHAPIYVGGQVSVWDNPLECIGIIPDYWDEFLISVDELNFDKFEIIIPEIEILISKGTKIVREDYYTHRDAYYHSKIAELL